LISKMDMGLFLELKEDLERGYDYEIIPRKVWMRFKAWFVEY